ncbi:MAG: SHOCT domain-containing protein [Gammaproteobacteria bacterium]
MLKKSLASFALLSTLAGCASNPDNIDASYVSPLKYADYDCAQIGMEMDYVGQRTGTLYQNLKDKRNADNWQMGVGLVLFWPTLFALEGGDGADAAEYARLKGEFEALRQTSTQKSCGIIRRSPDQILDAAREADAATEGLESSSTSLADRLRELDDLHDQGLISDEEYQVARQRALGI